MYVLWRMWRCGWCMSGRWSKDWKSWPHFWGKKLLTRHACLTLAAQVTVGFQKRLGDCKAAERFLREEPLPEAVHVAGQALAPTRLPMKVFPEVEARVSLFWWSFGYTLETIAPFPAMAITCPRTSLVVTMGRLAFTAQCWPLWVGLGLASRCLPPTS